MFSKLSKIIINLIIFTRKVKMYINLVNIACACRGTTCYISFIAQNINKKSNIYHVNFSLILDLFTQLLFTEFLLMMKICSKSSLDTFAFSNPRYLVYVLILLRIVHDFFIRNVSMSILIISVIYITFVHLKF